MCNLYSQTRNVEAIRRLFRISDNRASRIEPQPAIFPGWTAPVIRKADDGERELLPMSWDFVLLQDGKAPRRVTNVRDDKILMFASGDNRRPPRFLQGQRHCRGRLHLRPAHRYELCRHERVRHRSQLGTVQGAVQSDQEWRTRRPGFHRSVYTVYVTKGLQYCRHTVNSADLIRMANQITDFFEDPNPKRRGHA